MTYDTHFRYSQALDPSSLDSVAACLHALQAAAKDCLNAGLPFEGDPAVMLLARHMGNVAVAKMPDQMALRSLCAEAIAALSRKPLLITLARRGVGHDDDAKRLFQGEVRKALRRLAEGLGLDPADYDLRVCSGGTAVPAGVILHSEQIYVHVSTCVHRTGEVLFHRVRGRSDFVGERNYRADIGELVQADRFAAKISRDLSLGSTMQAQPRLVA